ncbi:MAG: hypothetical protein E7205_07670 [Tissierellaceae bacterium]|jgi:protein arginine kinase activator|nr:hypothetical protein [Tissierellaceae bacterium]
MLCQQCKKRPATMHYTKIVNGVVTEIHLCSECAKEYKDVDFDTNFSFHKFLTGLIDNIQGETVKENKCDLKCSYCGMDYNEFKQTGKLGCPNCYISFKEKLIPLLTEIHGHNNHIGKIPKASIGTIGIRTEIDKLKVQLDNYVKEEQFERAAVIRDKIKKLQKDIEQK